MNPVSIEFVIANWFENIIVRQEQFGGEDICSSFCLGVIQAIKISVLKCLTRAGMLPVKQCVSQFMSQSRYTLGGCAIRIDADGQPDEIQQHTSEELARECFRLFDESDSAEMYSKIELSRHDWETGMDEILETMTF